MNFPSASTEALVSVATQREADTRLRGRWLKLALYTWIVLVVLILIVFFASIPVYFMQLQTICTGGSCAQEQLSPASVRVFQNLNLSVSSYAIIRFILGVVLALVWFALGAVLAWRKFNDWMALLVALMLIMLGAYGVTNTVAGSHSAWQFPSLLLNFLAFGALFLVFSLFPNGRFVPRWTCWLLIPFLVESVSYNYFSNWPDKVNIWFNLLSGLVWIGTLLSVVIAQTYRYVRVSTPLQRQQTKWFIFVLMMLNLVEASATVPTLIFPSLGQPDSFYYLAWNLVEYFVILLIPLSLGLAVLRYRLWDIDIIINRTLVYGILTGALALIYFSSVFVLQFLLRGIISQTSTPAIIISTLAIAVLFQPLRQRIQSIIDRRFYRRKYDAARTLETFSATLRNELDLDQLSEQLVEVVQETMQPAHVSLWLRKTEQEAGTRNVTRWR